MGNHTEQKILPYQKSKDIRYIGKHYHGLPTSFGIITFKNGDTYRGLWKKGKRSGKGEQ